MEKQLEHYFIDTILGKNHVFQKGDKNEVIWNLNISLAYLGFGGARGSCEFNDRTYDAIHDFQKQNEHPNIDGSFGPGTRKLLVNRLLNERGKNFFHETLTEIRLEKEYLRKLLIDTSPEKVLSIFAESNNDFVDKNEITLLQSRIKQLNKENNTGIIGYESYTKELNKIRSSVMNLIDDLPDLRKCKDN